MHKYYIDKKNELRNNLDNYLKYMKDDIKKETKVNFNKFSDELWDVYYNKYIEKFPYIGGDNVSGTINFTGAYVYIALGDVLTNKYNVSLERWGEIVSKGYKKFFEHFPKFLRNIVGKLYKNEKLINKVYKKRDLKNNISLKSNRDGFDTEVQPLKENYSLIYHVKRCPVYEFAKKMQCEKFMPYICNFDYIMFESFNVPFVRTMTCSCDDDYCDFGIKKDGELTPSWPCHILDENDNLK